MSSTLYSQINNTLMSEFEVIYRLKSSRDTLSKNNNIEEDLSLLINGNKSLFKSTQKAISDSIAVAVGNKSFDNPVNGKVIIDMRTVPIVKFKSEVFSDNGKQTVYKVLLKNNFSYLLEDPIEWKIHDETKTITSYLCRKATGKYKNRNYIVWFTEAIPIPDGPYVFKGLPGLVVEVYDTLDYNHFSMISFKKVEKPIILMKDVFSTKYSTFFETRKNFLDNPAAILSNQTNINLSSSAVSKINTNSKYFNNYID